MTHTASSRPDRFISPARKRRLAVMEAGIAVAACLLPAIDPLDYVTAAPSSKSPVGRTVLKPNVGRYTTGGRCVAQVFDV